MPSIVEIDRTEDLPGIQLHWNYLFSQTRNASFFQTFDWFRAYWQHYGAGQKMRVLVVQSGGRPIGILPLAIRTEPTRVGGIRVLTYPLHDWGTFYGPIGPNPAATLVAGLSYLAASPRDWDLLDLRWIDKHGTDFGRTATALETAGLSFREAPYKETTLVDTRGAWDEYFAARTGKFRNNIRRCQKRAAELGQLEHVRYRPLGAGRGDDDPRWDLFEKCIEVARRSWQGASRTGTTLSHESILPFIRATHELAAKNGMLDLNVLTIDGRVVAFAYNYHHQGSVFGMRMGYEPSLARVGIGAVMYAAALKDSFDRGDHAYDIGPGTAEIKRFWMTDVVRSYRYTHYPLTSPRTQVLRLKHWLQDRGILPATEPQPTAV
jgi:CelD/BcsL family acetyltransferase involved in cellulose biosynthesis